MTLMSPRLDDRNFDDLYAEAIAHMRAVCPEWRGDLSPGDPSAVLLDIFAYLTEVMLYRVNRLPEKAYVELLRLVGIRREPPAAAMTLLELRTAGPATSSVRIPRGTRVSVEGDRSSREISFVLVDDAVIQGGPGSSGLTRVLAMACDLVPGELVGVTSGNAGQKVRVARAPIITPPPLRLDESQLFLGRELVVGVEAGAGEADVLPFEIEGKRFRRFYETDHFSTDSQGWPRVFRVDRLAGEIEFPPEALLDDSARSAGIPPVGREIRVWYARGGGSSGNVAAGSLSRLVDPIAGISVTNPEPARGGRDEESLAAVMRRAPEELGHRDRAVTASDYEKLALRASPAVCRVYVDTPADHYAEDRPGTVEVRIVVDPAHRERRAAMSAVNDVRAFLDARRPLGSSCDVALAYEKAVTVKATVVAAPAVDPVVLQQAVETRLSRLLSPIPVAGETPWEFGRTLHVSHVYEALNSVPGVRHVAGEIEVGQTPAPLTIDALEADADRPRTFYLASGRLLFRSENDGLGWEPTALELGKQETIVAIRSHPQVPNTIAVATKAPGLGSWLHVSEDGGETFPFAPFALAGEEVRDIGWDALDLTNKVRPLERVLWVGSSGGLRRVRLSRTSPRSTAEWLVAEVVDLRSADKTKLLAVDRITTTYRAGKSYIAVVCRDAEEVHFGATFPNEPMKLSRIWPWPGTTDRASPWCIAFQQLQGHTYLWMGSRAEGRDQPGCRAADVTDPTGGFGGWAVLEQGWKGGSCTALATRGAKIFAATASAGVLELALRGTASEWLSPKRSANSRNPALDQQFLEQRLTSLAIMQHGTKLVVLAGGEKGLVLRWNEVSGGLPFEPDCYHARRFDSTSDFITLPRGGTFAATNLPIEVVRDA